MLCDHVPRSCVHKNSDDFIPQISHANNWKMSPLLSLAQAGSLLWCQLRSLLLLVLDCARILLISPFVGRPSTKGCVFYEGTVRHLRLAPVRHEFSYRVRYCLVELGAEDASPFAIRQLTAGCRMSLDEARAMSGCDGRVSALLLPASAGYEQNPIVVYYCYDAAGQLRCCLAEVTNTPWGDRVAFPFAPSGDSLPKPLHVSPLQDMDASWSLHATAPGETLQVRVGVEHTHLGAFFVATLDARVVPQVSDPEWWGLFMAHRVAIWIYYHAVVLMIRKGLPFLTHPKYDRDVDYHDTIKSKSDSQGWKACPVLGVRPSVPPADSVAATCKAGKRGRQAASPPRRVVSSRGAKCDAHRSIVWTDASHFPWA